MKISKKAVMEDFLQLIAWAMMIIIIFFIFMGVKTVKIKTLIDNTQDIKQEIDGNYLLIDFLKQKTDNSKTENIAELISLYYQEKDKDIFIELEEKTRDHFSKSFLESAGTSWIIRIYDFVGNEIQTIPISSPPLYKKEEILSQLILPILNEEGDYLSIELSLITKI